MSKSVRIEMTAHGVGRVWIDDVERTDVTSISFRSEPGGVNEVEIVEKHYPAKVTIVGPARDGG